MAAASAGAPGSKGSFDFKQVGDQLFMRESESNPNPGQPVYLRKRAQRNDVVISIMHGIRITGILLRILEVGFVQNHQYPLGDEPIKLFELMARKNRAGRIIRVRQIDDFGFVGNRRRQGRQIVAPVPIRHSVITDTAGSREHLKTHERRFGRQHFVVISEKGADDIRHDAFGPAAGNHVFDPDFVLTRQNFPQMEATSRVAIQPAERAADAFKRQR